MNQDTIKLLNYIEFLYEGAERFTRGEELLEDNVLEIQNTLLEAKNNLRAFILDRSDIKVQYEYKLRNNATMNYLAAGLKDEGKKGKTWTEQRFLNSALTHWINDVCIWNMQPHPGYTKEIRNGQSVYVNTPEYEEWQTVRYKARIDDNYRAAFIPETWTVIAIPINTKSEIKEINAREFYLGGMTQ